MAPVKTANKSQKITKKFVINAVANEEQELLDVASLVKFLHERVKVDGHTGNLGDAITITRDGNKITIVSTTKFSGKYVKYLTKKFLKKNSLRDWLRVVASSRGVYEIRFFNLIVSDNEEEEEDDDEEEEEDEE